MLNFKVIFTETYLEPSQTSMMELFCKNSSQLAIVKCFLKKAPLWMVEDSWLESKYSSRSLGMPCEMALLNSFILQYLCHNQFAFYFWKWKHYLEKYLIANSTRFTLNVYKPFTVGKKLTTCQERPDMVCSRFIKMFYKTTTCPTWLLLSGLKSGCLAQVLL